MKTALSLVTLTLLFSGLAFARPPSELFTNVRNCQGWIHPAASTPYGLSIGVYVHTGVLGSPPSATYADAHGFVTEVHQTTNNFFRRDAQSARVQGTISSSGVTTTTVNTAAFAGCSDCYAMTIVSSAAGHVLTGTIRFVGDPTHYTIDCSPTAD